MFYRILVRSNGYTVVSYRGAMTFLRRVEQMFEILARNH
jgi:hypothetical protein